MENLVRGVHYFQSNIFRSEQELFEKLADGQSPDALFITCSDSRINPNLITNTKPGELFILRNAGNIVPPLQTFPNGEAATIEFAVTKLGIQDIIICGHTHCGAMKGLLDPTILYDTPILDAWLKYAAATKRILEVKYADLEKEALLDVATMENVLVQLENLRTHPAVAAAMAAEKLKLHGWIYKMETGEVLAFDPALEQFKPLNKSHQAGLGDLINLKNQFVI